MVSHTSEKNLCQNALRSPVYQKALCFSIRKFQEETLFKNPVTPPSCTNAALWLTPVKKLALQTCPYKNTDVFLTKNSGFISRRKPYGCSRRHPVCRFTLRHSVSTASTVRISDGFSFVKNCGKERSSKHIDPHCRTGDRPKRLCRGSGQGTKEIVFSASVPSGQLVDGSNRGNQVQIPCGNVWITPQIQSIFRAHVMELQDQRVQILGTVVQR